MTAAYRPITNGFGWELVKLEHHAMRLGNLKQKPALIMPQDRIPIAHGFMKPVNIKLSGRAKNWKDRKIQH